LVIKLNLHEWLLELKKKHDRLIEGGRAQTFVFLIQLFIWDAHRDYWNKIGGFNNETIVWARSK